MLEIVNLDVVGASEPEFINCLAAIYLSSKYRGALDDENKKNISSYDISFGVIIVTNSMGIILLLIALFLQKMYIEDTSITFHYSQYKK